MQNGESVKSLNRRGFIGTATAAAFASVAFVRLPGEAAEFTLKYGNDLPAGHPMNVHARQMVDAIKRETNGRVEIGVFPDNQLGGDTAMIGQVRSGALDFLNIPDTVLSTIVPVTAIDGLAFAFPDYKHVWSAVDGDLGSYARKQIEGVDLYPFTKLWNNGYREITTNTRPIHEPGDLKGLKIRVPASPLVVSMFKSLGAAPTPINWSETYTSLQTHVVDAEENPLAIIDVGKLNEVQKYCSLTNHMWNGYWLVANGETGNKIPKSLQAIIERNFDAAADGERADTEKLEHVTQSKLQAKGMVFNTVDPAAFRTALQQSGFYTEWKQKFGDHAWAALEKYSSRLA
jgi:tripartite ATP-independent transporter DctP family solute receptor